MILLLLLIPSSFSINTTVDYTKIRERFHNLCEDHCYFEESEINSRTIEKWPLGNCTYMVVNMRIRHIRWIKYKGCEGGTIISENATLYRICEHVVGKLTISNLKDQIPKLPNVIKISGGLEVQNTTSKDLSFFKNLEEIVMKSGKEPVLNIQNNPKMTRLGFFLMKFTKKDYGSVTLNFQNLHPDFCLTVIEMALFTNVSANFLNVEARFCDVPIWLVDLPKLCLFDDMAKLETKCVYIHGDLLIDSGDEKYVGKLVKVTHIFGSVTIRNTNLENLDFLRKLEKVVSLDKSSPVMQVLSNKNLRNLQLPRITAFVTSGSNTLIINDNHPDCPGKLKDCLNLQLAAKTNVSINGKPCRSIQSSDSEQDIEYSESEPDFWNDYDSGFLDFNKYQNFGQFWMNTGNFGISIFGLIINIFHLKALCQLWTNSTFVLMYGICICDILYVSTFIIEKQFNWIYDPCDGHPYIRVLAMDVIKFPIQEFTRKSSSILVFLMASYHYITSQSPKNRYVLALLKPSWAFRFIIIVFLLIAYQESRDPILCRIIKIRDGVDKCGGQLYYRKYEDGNSALSQQFNAYFAITLTILHLLIISILIIQKIERRREHEAGLVTVMAIFCLFSESFHWMYYRIDYFLELYYTSFFSTLEAQGQDLLWCLLTVNSSIHCFICFSMSSQYRSVVRRLYWRK